MWLRLLDNGLRARSPCLPVLPPYDHPPTYTHTHTHTTSHSLAAASNWRANAARVVEETAVKLKKATQRAKAAADEVDILLKEDQSSGKRPNFKIFVDEGTIPNGKAPGRWQG